MECRFSETDYKLGISASFEVTETLKLSYLISGKWQVIFH